MKRIIVHSDINHAYAQIEEMMHPELRKVPMAVGGSEEKRNGIILAKNDLAKKYNIKTGESLRDAYKKCPDLCIIHPHYEEYMYYTEKIKDIYRTYTDKVESFGLDEAWMDLSASQRLFGDGIELASNIQEEVYRKYGMTVSMGVSYNKIFAKLGSDLQKKKGFVVIDENNYKEEVWPLPVEDLMMVGVHTQIKLNQMQIYTIGDLANYPLYLLQKRLGKMGNLLWQFANGLDTSEVKPVGYKQEIKSIGNGKTAIRDIQTMEQLYEFFRVLSEAVAARLRAVHKKGWVVSMYLRDTQLRGFSRQIRLKQPTDLAKEILQSAMYLVRKENLEAINFRGGGISVSDLCEGANFEQLSLFEDVDYRLKQRKTEALIETIRERFGYNSCSYASIKVDQDLTDFNPKGDHVIHPVSFLDGGIKL